MKVFGNEKCKVCKTELIDDEKCLGAVKTYQERYPATGVVNDVLVTKYQTIKKCNRCGREIPTGEYFTEKRYPPGTF